jgi:hypothetical protein
VTLISITQELPLKNIFLADKIKASRNLNDSLSLCKTVLSASYLTTALVSWYSPHPVTLKKFQQPSDITLL